MKLMTSPRDEHNGNGPLWHGRRLFQWLTAIAAIVAVSLLIHSLTSPAGREAVLRNASTAELQHAALRDPSNPRIFYYLGQRFQREGQPEPAAKAFERAAQLAPDDGEICVARAKAVAAMQDLQQAEDLLTVFVQKHPNSAVADIALAQILEITGGHRRSYELATAAAKLDPQNAEAWQLVGTESIERHDYFTGESALRRSIQCAPKDWHNHLYLGRALTRLGRNSEAIAQFRTAAQLAPGEALAHLELGKGLLENAALPDDFDKARQSLLAANSLQNTMPPDGAYATGVALGKSYAQQERWREAWEWLHRAEALAPGDRTRNADVHFELARVYQGLGDSKNAAREREMHRQIRGYIDQRIALTDMFTEKPGDTTVGLKLARLCAAQGDEQAAVDIYRRLLEQSPHLIAAQNELNAILGRK